MTNSQQQKNDSALFNTTQEHPIKNNRAYSARTIMLVGRAGSGKSALANAIAGTDDFSEGSGCTSGTRNYQTKSYLIDDNLYRIIDTVGIEDTELTEKQVADATDFIKDGLHQILFVINGRFTEAEVRAYDLLRELFDRDVVELITIVKTCFPEFKNSDKCEEDYKNMIKENGNLSEIVQKCKKVIYVDNPQLVGYYKEIAEISRADSREKILDHLSDCKEIYFPKQNGIYEKLCKEIEDLKKKEEEREKKFKELEQAYVQKRCVIL
nr:14536_t:CDS:1 [Entrophospora candida]